MHRLEHGDGGILDLDDTLCDVADDKDRVSLSPGKPFRMHLVKTGGWRWRRGAGGGRGWRMYMGVLPFLIRHLL